MVTAISELTKIMGMAFLKVANTNDESANGYIENVDLGEDNVDL